MTEYKNKELEFNKNYDQIITVVRMKKKLIEMNDELFCKVVKSAQKNDRSVNKEISSLIKKGLKK
jgi:hypothetical protein